MAPVIAFWGAAMLVAAASLPLSHAVFRRFPDAGAGLSFALGLLLTGYVYFIARTASVLPAGRGGYILAVSVVALVSIGVAGRDPRFRATALRTVPALAGMAGLFTVAFFGYVTVRSYTPQISGTEQPMDLMYLNATLASPDYPPQDPWLSGSRASYYYFGYVQVGALTSIAGVRAEEGYNLGLAYTFAAAATAAASLTIALARWALGRRGRRWTVAAGGLGVAMLLLVGTLAGVFELAAAHEQYDRGLYDDFGVAWMLPCEQGQSPPSCYQGAQHPRTNAWYPTQYFFWFNDTRLVPSGMAYVISEFPFFSFLLGDLHPHVMALPVVLLALGFAAALWRGRRRLSWRSHRRSPWPGLLLAVVLGALAFQNAWDVVTFTVVVAGAVFARNLRGAAAKSALAGAAGFLAPVLVMAVVAYLPWYVDFRSQAAGVAPYVQAGTRPAHAFLQFGPLLAAASLSLAWAWRGAGRKAVGDALAVTLWAPTAPLLGWILFAQARGELHDGVAARGEGAWLTLVAFAAATWLLTAAFALQARTRRPAALIPGLAAVAALLLYGAELFLIKDVFYGSQPRMNTVFKLSYQAWILLSVSGGVAVAVALREAFARRLAAGWLAAPVLGLLALGLVYPVTALANRVCESDPNPGLICDPNRKTTIDGLADTARLEPDDYAVARWVAAHTPPDAVVVEATGRAWARGTDGKAVLRDPNVDYGPAGRISARTGRPAPIGWFFHEIQWRGQASAFRARLELRQEVVDSVYLAPDAVAATNALRRLGARYLVVSTVEQSKYPAELMPKFEQFLDVAFESGNARVYALPVREVMHTS